jgi:hypothetical protein
MVKYLEASNVLLDFAISLALAFVVGFVLFSL